MLFRLSYPNFRHARIELTSENDLFFHFQHIVNERTFRDMQAGRAAGRPGPGCQGASLKAMDLTELGGLVD